MFLFLKREISFNLRLCVCVRHVSDQQWDGDEASGEEDGHQQGAATTTEQVRNSQQMVLSTGVSVN